MISRTTSSPWALHGGVYYGCRKLRSTLSSSWLAVMLCVLFYGYSEQVWAQPDARQSSLFVNNCAQCHARTNMGAPFVGIAEDWQDAVTRGEDAMLTNVVQGIRGMPPLGYCSACSEEDSRVLIRMMAGITDRQEKKQ